MKELVVDAITKNVEVVKDFVNSFLEEQNCPSNVIMKIDIAVDELFSNIANYSYGSEVGSVTVRVSFDPAECIVKVTFIDEGMEYNPLDQKEPDSSVIEDSNKIGGLGIFITKKLMDDISYQYNEGKNITIIYKKTGEK